MSEVKSAFCSCRGIRPPYYVREGQKICGLCMKPRLPLPADPVAILLTDPDIDPKTGKLTPDHMEDCNGCALCEPGD